MEYSWKKMSMEEIRKKFNSMARWSSVASRYAILLATSVLALLTSCANEPVPVYAPAPSTFDRAWNAALGAARDEGVQFVSEDRVSGIINGTKGDQEVTISMRTQADGNVRVEFGQRGPKGSDPGLGGRISRAYDRRMGR